MKSASRVGSFSNLPGEATRRSCSNPTLMRATAKVSVTGRDNSQLWSPPEGGSMKLKHPAVLRLTSICHYKFGKQKAKESDGKKYKGEIFSDLSGQKR